MRLQILAALSSILMLSGLLGCAQGYFKGSNPDSPIKLNVTGYEAWTREICATKDECAESNYSLHTLVKLEKDDAWLQALLAYWPETVHYTIEIGEYRFTSIKLVCIEAGNYFLLTLQSKSDLQVNRDLNIERCDFGLLFEGDIRNQSEAALKDVSIEGHWAKLMSKYRYLEGSYSEQLKDDPLEIEEQNVKWIVNTLSGVVGTDS